MKLEGEQTLLRVYLRNTDKYGWWRSAADTLVSRARKRGMAGATVLRGFFGLDIDGQLLEPELLSVSERRPVIIEIVDSPKAIGEFLTDVAEIVQEGLVTLERAHVLRYRTAHHGSPQSLKLPAITAEPTTMPLVEDFPAMQMNENGQLLRIFIGEADVCNGEPLYRAIVMKVKELGLAGATVLHGAMGFGANSRMHTSRLLELSTDMPIVIEIVDTSNQIEKLMPFLDQVVVEGMITVEAVKVLRYRQNEAKVRP